MLATRKSDDHARPPAQGAAGREEQCAGHPHADRERGGHGPDQSPGLAGSGSAPSQQTFYRARSRLYRSQLLQVNNSMRLKALAEIYKMHSFALLQNRSEIFNLNLADFRQNLKKIQKKVAKFAEFCKS